MVKKSLTVGAWGDWVGRLIGKEHEKLPWAEEMFFIIIKVWVT